MPRAFSQTAPANTWDPTNRPLWSPQTMAESAGDGFLGLIQGLLNEIPGESEIVTLIDNATGLDLADLSTALEGIDLTDPGSVLAAIENAAVSIGSGFLTQILNVLGVTGATTATSGGNSSLNVIGTLLSDAASIPGDLLALIFGTNASQQAQINALQSGGFTYDPATNGVTGWSNLVGVLATSSRGSFIQALTTTVAYRASGLAVDNYGVSFVINPTMRGVAGAGICADSLGASWIGLLAYRGFDGDALWLVKAASPTLYVVIKQYDLVGANRFSGLTTLDLKTDGINNFWVEINGKPVALGNNGAIPWTDSTGLATHNSTHRGVIIVSNMLNGNQDSYYGPALNGKIVSYAS